MDRQQEFVLRTIEDRDVRFVRMWFTDVTAGRSRDPAEGACPTP
jgi:glutamine synthetase